MYGDAHRFLSGRRNYVPDIVLPGLEHVAFVRSPLPHGQITGIDVSEALALPDVRAVVTAGDLARAAVAQVSHMMPSPPFQPLTWPLLAARKVRYVGDPVAAVVADDPYRAVDAAESVRVSYVELPHVLTLEDAPLESAPLLYEEWGTNTFVADSFTFGDLDAAFARAEGVIAERFDHHKLSGLPLEGRGVVAAIEPSGKLAVHASTQFPHQMRTVLADLIGEPVDRVRVIAPDVGGGFGLKQHVTREELLIPVLTHMLGVPLRWVQGMAECLDTGPHARRQYHDVEAAYAADGRVLGLRINITADVGDPVLYFTGAGPAFVTAASVTGAYDIPAYSYEVRAVATNSPPVGGFRGFGQPQAVLTMERLLDLVAERLELTPSEVRTTNLIPDAPRPFVSPTGAAYDIGSVRNQFEHLLANVSPPREARQDGILPGRGYACYVEPTAPNLHSFAGRYGAYEIASVAVQPDGRVVVTVGTKDLGQGNNKAFALIAANELGVSAEDVVVRDGDTDLLPIGLGTMGSRTIVLAGTAVHEACCRLRDKMSTLARHILGVALDAAVTFHDGRCVSDTKSMSLAELADVAYHRPYMLPEGTEPGLFSTGVAHARHADAFPDPDGRMNAAATYASHVACADVEVDQVSGEVRVVEFTVVYDCGEVISAPDLTGQLQGGLCHGLSGTLFEHLGDSSGTALSGYRLARAAHVPRVRALPLGTPSPFGIGARGAGQLATILAPAAIANGVAAALGPRAAITTSHLTPDVVRRLARQRTTTVRGSTTLDR